MKDRIGNELKEGDFILYVARGDRHPVINFGYILEINEKVEQHVRHSDGYTWETRSAKLKIHKTLPDGTRLNKTVTEYGEYDEISRCYPNKYIRDTGKPDTTRLECYGEEDNRLMVTEQV